MDEPQEPQPQHGGQSLLLGSMANTNDENRPRAHSPAHNDVEDDGIAQAVDEVNDQLQDAALDENGRHREEPMEQDDRSSPSTSKLDDEVRRAQQHRDPAGRGNSHMKSVACSLRNACDKPSLQAHHVTQESKERSVGPRMAPKSVLEQPSPECSTRHYPVHSSGESVITSSPSTSIASGTSYRTSGCSGQSSNVLASLREVLKAQCLTDVIKYNGKNSLGDFLRMMDFKYPSTVWNDSDRRDIMVNLLEGQAKMLYKTLPKAIKEGSYEGIVTELRAARNNPCERLQLLEQWDTLRKKDGETVSDLCFRMEKLSRKLHAEDDRDFLLGSKLHQCLSHWKDSYHLLTELDRHEGEIYQAVKKAALRLERTQQTQSKEQSDARRVFSDRTSKPWRKKEKFESRIELQNSNKGKEPSNRRCFKCNELGHYASKCRKLVNKGGDGNATAQKPSGSLQARDRRTVDKSRGGSFSTHVKGWCYGIRNDTSGTTTTEAYGKPYICDVNIMNVKAKAMIDTGSIISILPLGLLKLALENGSPLDDLVTMLGDGDSRKIVDASGNEMSFLMLVATDVQVLGAGLARVQFHIQKTPDTLILLGMNALKSLGIQICMNRTQDTEPCQNFCGDTATATERRVIPPGAAAILSISSGKEGERLFLSKHERIASGVCKITSGVGSLSVVNRECEPWIVHKGEELGKWSEDAWCDPRTLDIAGDMLEFHRTEKPPRTARLESLKEILSKNRRTGSMPQGLLNLIDNSFSVK
ncbi:hypothetical protein ANCCAN_08440 [Ancylostoma caninum]|uniref:CCHC-type domain-containing protein n=1 Tax=Ancylostoma caninum TaxID=29170 RepID=A0A368GMP4_ANCCA|nr:hypothetical protein ANCCAN_08440 [Ancylostoma caninum]